MQLITPEESSVLACVADCQEWSQRRDRPVLSASVVNAFVERSEAPLWSSGFGRAHEPLGEADVPRLLRSLCEKWMIEYDAVSGSASLTKDGRNYLFGL